MASDLNVTSSGMGEWPFVDVRTCFYMLLPHETYFETVKDVPLLTGRVYPPVTVMVFIEVLVLLLIGRSHEVRIHSAVVSWASFAMYEAFTTFFLRGIELSLYQWVYDNFRFMTLPWNGLATFFFGLLTVEFCGYWWHRMSHELAIMWALHELHHSSDDFNLSIAFRNSAPMRLFKWVFYLPLAFFGLPTSIMITHLALGLIFNGFSHLHVVPKLWKVIPGIGHIVEYIFVTPSHHRVHHASNFYCIDKNYGQHVIIWDRLFGTFVEEREDEPLTYGSLTQPQTYDMAKLQFSSFVKLGEKFNSVKGFGDKFRALFYGPGWFPGTPRLGNAHEIPDVRGRKKYSPKYPLWVSFYLVINAYCVFYSYLNMVMRVKEVSELHKFINLIYIFFGFSAIGGLYDRQGYSPALELSRLVVILGLSQVFPMFSATKATTLVRYIHYADLLVWPFLYNFISNSNEKQKHYEDTSGKVSNGKVSNGKVSNGKVTNGKVSNGKVSNGKQRNAKPVKAKH